MITIRDLVDHLEAFAPPAFQEDYDNSGLLTGDPAQPATATLVALDCTEEIVDEAIATGANMIIAHHPIVFRPLKRITGRDHIERTIIKAIRNNIAIYAIHTNLDNVYRGVNNKIASRIGLKNLTILLPKSDTLSKLVTFVPTGKTEHVLASLHAAGAGNIGDYKQCSFRVQGTGTFLPGTEADPTIGKRGRTEHVAEDRIEVIFPSHLRDRLLTALTKSHPYEEVAYYLTRLENENQEVGAGLIGTLEQPAEPIEFLKRLKSSMGTKCVRHTALVGRKIERVAVCGGAGSFLLPVAIRKGADAFVTADFKYHEFFGAEGKLVIADIGHYESEQFTKELIAEVLWEKFPTFAINFSKTNTNPISYL
jgi:dinuclear metal center YbgI/SA1388 family protein